MSVANDAAPHPHEQQQQEQQGTTPQPQPIHIVVNIRHAPQSECIPKSAAAAAAAILQGSSSDGVKKKVKRNVALHIGYVGTNYTGERGMVEI